MMIDANFGLSNKPSRTKKLLTALVANQKGEIVELKDYAAVGMAGNTCIPLSVENTDAMPYGSELMFLPDRQPVVFNRQTRQIETLKRNPYAPAESIFPVAAFNSPGYVVTQISAYRETARAGFLPLFCYGAVGWHRGKYRSAVMLVDDEPRQDLRRMKHEDVLAGVEQMRREMPANRLRAHLEKCALQYGCPAGKNFFLGRYEAPLPTAKKCNARCLGCLSLQKNSGIPHSQDRIAFTPSAEEIAQVALAHIRRVKHSVVSFGQGCEGEPLLAAKVIEPAIRQIRSQTSKGTIHMNTNGSKPETLRRLFEAGLDSVRISMNSVRQDCYDAYFRPRGYTFGDVVQSIDTTLGCKKYIAINNLSCPGVTDAAAECQALLDFLRKHPIHMIQWRNLNFDPLRYWQEMNRVASHGEAIGMQTCLNLIRKQFPKLKFGYFNPPKEKFYS